MRLRGAAYANWSDVVYSLDQVENFIEQFVLHGRTDVCDSHKGGPVVPGGHLVVGEDLGVEV